MTTTLRCHIVHPYHGWYLCGYVPLHRHGVRVQRDRDGLCARCARIAAQREEERTTAPDGEEDFGADV